MNWREAVYFLAQRAAGSRVRAVYREFLRMENESRARFEAESASRLDRVLAEAVRNIPFYRDRLGSTPAKLENFPVLKKSDLVRHFDAMMHPSLRQEWEGRARRAGRYSWVAVRTGGSTGVPTTVIHDAAFRDQGRASRLYSQRLCGFPIGTPYFMLWGSMDDISAAGDSLSRRLLNAVSQVRLLNAFKMDTDRMAGYARRINESSIRHLMAYVDAADQMARYAAGRGLRLGPLESVMACAGTVTEDIRARLESVFGGRVHNKYGSRDCTDMACDCSEGRMHVYGHHVHLEVVDDRDAPVAPGVTGRLLVTLLGNDRFPMIRYEIGDIGALGAEPCPCGRPFPVLASVQGRIMECLNGVDGQFVTPVYIRHLIGVVHNPDNRLQRFQLNQLAADRFQLLLQLDPDHRDAFRTRLLPDILRDLRVVLGERAEITTAFPDRIEESASGKFLYVRNLARKPPTENPAPTP